MVDIDDLTSAFVGAQSSNYVRISVCDIGTESPFKTGLDMHRILPTAEPGQVLASDMVVLPFMLIRYHKDASIGDLFPRCQECEESISLWTSTGKDDKLYDQQNEMRLDRDVCNHMLFCTFCRAMVRTKVDDQGPSGSPY